jgi:hypothetical protein
MLALALCCACNEAYGASCWNAEVRRSVFAAGGACLFAFRNWSQGNNVAFLVFLFYSRKTRPMKRLLIFFLLAAIALVAPAQSAQRGFDYNGHAKMNKQAKRWGERRVKASRNDQTNLKCSPRESRKYARKQRR